MPPHWQICCKPKEDEMAKKFGKVKATRKPSAKKLAADSAAETEKETKRHMNELMQAATEFFKAGTAFFLLNTGKAAVAPEPVKAPEPETAVAPAEGPKRTRRTKEQIAADAAAADPLAALGLPSEPETPAPAAPKPLTDKESSDLLMKTAMEYVGHFGKVEGTAKAKAHLKPYKVEKITALAHEQRLPYIETLKAELTAAGK